MSLRLTSHQPLKEGRLDFDSQDWEIFPESYRMSYNSYTGNEPKGQIILVEENQNSAL